jgi:allantoin racemase
MACLSKQGIPVFVYPGSLTVFLDHGPDSIESHYDEVLAVPDTIFKVKAAERAGFDAVIIDCMGDPGLAAAREVVAIPVIGPAQAAMHLAAILGHRFSIVTVLERVFPFLEDLARTYGLHSKLASLRAVDIPVLELEADPQRLIDQLIKEAIAAIKTDSAHVIVFGCTGMVGCSRAVREGLGTHGYAGVPVIDPTLAALQLARGVVELGLTHSKRTYPNPPAKNVIGYW